MGPPVKMFLTNDRTKQRILIATIPAYASNYSWHIHFPAALREHIEREFATFEATEQADTDWRIEYANEHGDPANIRKARP